MVNYRIVPDIMALLPPEASLPHVQQREPAIQRTMLGGGGGAVVNWERQDIVGKKKKRGKILPPASGTGNSLTREAVDAHDGFLCKNDVERFDKRGRWESRGSGW